MPPTGSWLNRAKLFPPRVVVLTPDFALFPTAIGFTTSLSLGITKKREVGRKTPTRGGTNGRPSDTTSNTFGRMFHYFTAVGKSAARIVFGRVTGSAQSRRTGIMKLARRLRIAKPVSTTPSARSKNVCRSLFRPRALIS